MYFLKYTKIPIATILSMTIEARAVVVGNSGSGRGVGVGDGEGVFSILINGVISG